MLREPSFFWQQSSESNTPRSGRESTMYEGAFEVRQPGRAKFESVGLEALLLWRKRALLLDLHTRSY